MASDKVTLKVYDKDNVKDEIVCSMNFHLKEIVNHPNPEEGELRWVNLYGAPTGGWGGPVTAQMNQDPNSASNWKGRILMHTCSIDTKNPEFKNSELEPAMKTKATQMKAYDNTKEY